MKNKKNTGGKSKFRTVIESKGFYIALCTLIVIMGFSIYAGYQRSGDGKNSAFDDDAWQNAVEESGVLLSEEKDGAAEPLVSEAADVKESSGGSNEIPKENAQKTTEAEEAEHEMETVNQDLPEAKPAAASAVPLPEPGEIRLQLPCTGEITEPCSLEELVYCSAMDDWRTHNGMDIAAKEGEAVKAAADGTVSQVYEDELLGVVVVLDHGGGVSTLYGNLQSYDFIRAGTEVQVGDIIGGVGKPGALESEDEPHLHFEVHKNGEHQNPADFIE